MDGLEKEPANLIQRLWIKVQMITLCIESHSPESSERQTWWRWRVKESTDGPAKERVNAPNGSLITLIPHSPSCLELSLQTFQTETGNLGRLRMQRIPSSPDERSFLSWIRFWIRRSTLKSVNILLFFTIIYNRNIHKVAKKLIVPHKSPFLGSAWGPPLYPVPHVRCALAKWSNWYKLVSLDQTPWDICGFFRGLCGYQ